MADKGNLNGPDISGARAPRRAVRPGSPILGPVPRYPFITPATAALAVRVASGQRRSFQRDSARWIAGLHPPLRIDGRLPDLDDEGWVLLANHYARPGFRAWWIPIAISSIVPREVHWVTTSTLTFPDRWRSLWLTPLSEFALARISRCYGFTRMPPMPPRPQDVEARAAAVRRILAVVDQAPRPILGLAPEGGDSPGGVLRPLWPGAGRFLLHLAERGLRFIPIGVFESDDRLCLRIGPPFSLARPPGSSPDVRDAEAAAAALEPVAACLPPALRGAFAQGGPA